LHSNLKIHIRGIIDNPALILSTDPFAVTSVGIFNGLGWEDPRAIAAIIKMVPEMPHLEPLLMTRRWHQDNFFSGK
jgi:hypothetical protein